MFNTIELSLPKIGLEEDQENFILEFLDESINDVVCINEEGKEYVSSFRLVLSAIEPLTSKQAKLAEDVFIKEESIMHKTVESYDIDEIGVDLFA
ncbi:MAG: hypothetical protein COA42_12575 [Alteromonadaceae bacterium]|nr:MAG: hypothetical protein COA42_12575 [Alteromonadaceae bacterium]